MKIFNLKNGFTLLEILLVIGVVVILAGISMPIYQSFQVKADLGASAQSLVQNLRQAWIFSKAMKNDSSWGIYLETGKIVLFKGSSYASRDSSFDEETVISDSISLSGMNEIVFSKLSGLPQTTGSMTLTSSDNSTSTIIINSQGMIEY